MTIPKQFLSLFLIDNRIDCETRLLTDEHTIYLSKLMLQHKWGNLHIDLSQSTLISTHEFTDIKNL